MVEAREVKECRAEEAEGELREAARFDSRRSPMEEVVVRRSTSTMMIIDRNSVGPVLVDKLL